MVRTKFEALHRWKDAPLHVQFLRSYHRHIFHVTVYIDVDHNERQVEFFTFKTKLDEWIRNVFGPSYGAEGLYLHRLEFSCETMAEMILTQFEDATSVEVSEDGENGAHVCDLKRLRSRRRYLAQPREMDFIPSGRPARQAQGWGADFGNMNRAKSQATDVALSVRKECFIGQEAEGPHRGVWTLFVPGSVDLVLLKTTLAELDPYIRKTIHTQAPNGKPQIVKAYYGAGNDLTFNGDALKMVLDYFEEKDVTVEVLICTDKEGGLRQYIPGSVTIVSRSPHGHFNYHKWIEDGQIIWANGDTQYITLLSDSLFLTDTPVKQWIEQK